MKLKVIVMFKKSKVKALIEEKNPVVIEPFNPEKYDIIEEYPVYGNNVRRIIGYRSGEYRYFVQEPPLTIDEAKAIKDAIDKAREIALVSKGVSLLDIAVKKTCERLKVDPDVEKISYYIQRDYLGYGPIQAMMLDPNLEDISCNGVNIPVFVWHRKYGSLTTNVTITSKSFLRAFIRSIAARCGKHISGAFPVLDATLPEGYRIAATLDEVSATGSSFTIRKFRERPFTIVELIKDGVIDSTLAAFFWYMIENKRTFMIFGATGSGKTTLLNALLTFIHPSMKVCTVEETREITLPIKNWVPFVARKSYAIGETVGEVSLFDLVKVCLRYRPDYIIVGEVRGSEAYVLFQAMQSGHGGTSTIHAETLEGMLNRLTSAPMNIPKIMIPTLNFIVQIVRVKLGDVIVRRVKSLWEVRGVDDFKELSRWNIADDNFTHDLWSSRILATIANQHGRSLREVVEEIIRRKVLLDYLVENNIIEYDRIAAWITSYYLDPKATIEKTGKRVVVPSLLPLQTTTKPISQQEEISAHLTKIKSEREESPPRHSKKKNNLWRMIVDRLNRSIKNSKIRDVVLKGIEEMEDKESE